MLGLTFSELKMRIKKLYRKKIIKRRMEFKLMVNYDNVIIRKIEFSMI